jgi:hypothetical protein
MNRERIRLGLFLFMLAMGAVMCRESLGLGLAQMITFSALIALRIPLPDKEH